MTNTATPKLGFSRQGGSRKDTWFVSTNGVLNWTIVVKNLDGWVCLAHGTNEVLGFGSTREEAALKGLK